MYSNPYALPRFLLNLSIFTRLCICAISIILFLVLFMRVPLIGHNPIILVVPVTLVSWMFRRSGLIICILLLFSSLWSYYALQQKSLILSSNLMIYFAVSCLVLLFVGIFVSVQRNAFDLADEAQQQLIIAYQQQHKLNEIKDQFLQNVNHELRTPLTAIYGYLELLLEYNDSLASPMRVTFLGHAMQSCDELQLLVNNVLDSMGIESDKKRVFVEELAVMDIVHQVLERFDPKTLQTHRICVNVPPYIAVQANLQYTRQILRNLLSNAFKYAPEGTTITISATLDGVVVNPMRSAPEIRISVQDEGPGIPQEEIPLLFAQFVRLKRDTSGRVRGSGLGLYISKQFVELMEGRIWVESDGIEGQGSCFNFTLPCVPRPKVKPQIESYRVYHVSVPVDTQ